MMNWDEIALRYFKCAIMSVALYSGLKDLTTSPVWSYISFWAMFMILIEEVKSK